MHTPYAAAAPLAAGLRPGSNPAAACYAAMRRNLLAALLATSTLYPVPGVAQSPSAITVQSPWARATTTGVTTGGIYVTLTSPTGDRLVGATSPVAAKAALHKMRMDGTIMQMRIIPGGIELPPGQPVMLSPSGTHLMLEGLRAPLRRGTTVPVRLLFQKAPPVDMEAPVQSIGAAGPASEPPAMPGMPGMAMPK